MVSGLERGFVGDGIAPAHLLCLHHHDEHLPVAHAYLAIPGDDGVHELEGHLVSPPFLAVFTRGGAERHVAVVLEVDPRVLGIGEVDGDEEPIFALRP